MKKIIGKSKNINDTLPKQIIVDQIEINDAQSIADKFNEYYVNVGSSLASKIPEGDISYRSYLPKLLQLSVRIPLLKMNLMKPLKLLKVTNPQALTVYM